MKPVSTMCDYTTEQVYSHKLSIYSITSHLAGVDANMDCCSIGLLSLHTLDVDDILFPVDLDYFANLLAFVVSTDNLYVNTQGGQTNLPNMLHISYKKRTPQQYKPHYLDFVIFADGHGPHVVFLAELLRQGGRHDLPPDV